jgi:hypothetical protein
MPRKPSAVVALPNQALAAWWRNALTMWEISLAAPQVIAHRTGRMAKAGSSPNARDRKEFIRMGQEKAEAIGESALAIGMRLWQTQQAMVSDWVRQWVEQSSRMWAMPWQAPKWPSHREIDRTASSLMRLGMAPVHRRVTANAKRLRRVR